MNDRIRRAKITLCALAVILGTCSLLDKRESELSGTDSINPSTSNSIDLGKIETETLKKGIFYVSANIKTALNSVERITVSEEKTINEKESQVSYQAPYKDFTFRKEWVLKIRYQVEDNGKVLITIESETGLKKMNGWSLSKDGLRLTKIYETIPYETLVVTDSENNEYTVYLNYDKFTLKQKEESNYGPYELYDGDEKYDDANSKKTSSIDGGAEQEGYSVFPPQEGELYDSPDSDKHPSLELRR